MRTILLATLLISVYFRVGQSYCRGSDQCSSEECCVDLGINNPGMCRPLVQLNGQCTTGNADDRTAIYFMHCPCAAGLECSPSTGFLLTGTCVTP